MLNKIKNCLILLSAVIFVQFTFNINVLAKENLNTNSQISTQESKNLLEKKDIENNVAYNDENSDEDFSIFPIKSGVGNNKSWKIHFNKPIRESSLYDNVKIIDESDNSEIKIDVSIVNDRILNVVPLENYQYGKTYCLLINKFVRSMDDKILNKTVKMEFQVDNIIKDIKPVEISIKQEEQFEFPNTISALMSDGTYKDVKVKWNKYNINTSFPGKHTFYGQVDNYNNKVSLILEVKPFEKLDKISNNKRVQSKEQTSLYNYLMNANNRDSVLKKAIELHDGILKNNCVYFASEALRRSGVDLPTTVCNTGKLYDETIKLYSLTYQLQIRNWKVSRDLSQLLPGDICFTTCSDSGRPTHTYIFMKWVKENDYTYAYICDNQGYEYNNNSYHIRNIKIATITKDAFSYFMYKPV